MHFSSKIIVLHWDDLLQNLQKYLMTFICLGKLWFLVLNSIHLLLFLQIDVSAKWMWSDPTFPLCYTYPVYSILHMRSTWNFVQNPHCILVSWWFCNKNPQIFKNCFLQRNSNWTPTSHDRITTISTISTHRTGATRVLRRRRGRGYLVRHSRANSNFWL